MSASVKLACTSAFIQAMTSIASGTSYTFVCGIITFTSLLPPDQTVTVIVYIVHKAAFLKPSVSFHIAFFVFHPIFHSNNHNHSESSTPPALHQNTKHGATKHCNSGFRRAQRTEIIQRKQEKRKRQCSTGRRPTDCTKWHSKRKSLRWSIDETTRRCPSICTCFGTVRII